MPATDRMALSRKARAAGRTAVDTPPARSGRVWAEVLQEVPVFAGLSARHIRRIAGLSVVARFDARAPIVNAGDPGEAFYVVLTGRVTVRRGSGRATVQIGPGGYFGEMALVDGAPRSATVVAEGETTCLVLSRRAFAGVLEAEPAVAAALLRTLAARVRELEANPAD
jgi:CRP-like cAMP-binding protein